MLEVAGGIFLAIVILIFILANFGRIVLGLSIMLVIALAVVSVHLLTELSPYLRDATLIVMAIAVAIGAFGYWSHHYKRFSRPKEIRAMIDPDRGLPLKPSLQSKRGAKESLRWKADEHNRIAERVTDHLNQLIADDPCEYQTHYFARIARDLGLTSDEVRSALDCGFNGITIHVSGADRVALARFKSVAAEGPPWRVPRSGTPYPGHPL